MAYNPPIGSIYHLYTTYILPSDGLYNPYHPLQEPEKSIELLLYNQQKKHPLPQVSCRRLHLFPTPLATSKEIRGTDADPGATFWLFFVFAYTFHYTLFNIRCLIGTLMIFMNL